MKEPSYKKTILAGKHRKSPRLAADGAAAERSHHPSGDGFDCSNEAGGSPEAARSGPKYEFKIIPDEIRKISFEFSKPLTSFMIYEEMEIGPVNQSNLMGLCIFR